MSMVFRVPDITCEHCTQTIEGAVRAVRGVDAVKVDLDSKLVEIEGTAAPDDVSDAIKEAGYTPEPVTAVG